MNFSHKSQIRYNTDSYHINGLLKFNKFYIEKLNFKYIQQKLY